MCLDPAAVTTNARMASGQGAEALKNVITKGRLSDALPTAADCVCTYKSTPEHGVLLMQAVLRVAVCGGSCTWG